MSTADTPPVLYGYFRSSAAYRVRIALHLKGLAFDQVPVHLVRGEQRAPAYLERNPQGLVPMLQHAGAWITQSLAIIEYLEERFPAPPLLPPAAADRAFVRAIALAIACDMHPLNNLRVLRHLEAGLSQDESGRQRWYAHWIETGFTALEQTLSADPRVGTYCCGDVPGLADACLVPQYSNAERMRCALGPYPTLRRLVAHARAHPAFIAAEPARQPGAE